ncbi:hypothetical protein P154DRAFT_522649 [Amniculicola lignicola CBS 123094]|uniref:U3 small nucleolar RNA-associated protein 6 N-terminal domain-containing protein n=1 Tax=Amniculicola lignicola CBS 123094 TaxID=1392246 RepID=A0A6A5WFS4_9PLEO|nr:hypothetical protein P154DRAFT_522649 [Amniculicola lignicola CBS 123094]
MSGPSDKARFFLEQHVPELNELERKKIFTKEEISAIAKKRSDFEHIINARGSHPSDYVRYIEYEKNLDALRRKRIKRMGVRSAGSGQRTIFFLYNRATRKFSGDLGLWMQYIEFARKEKAFKKLNEILTAVVRLHPTKPELWVYAAQYFMETQADITNARSYMQRGLRFCKNSEHLWLEYAKLETIYIGKIAGRRKVLGLDVDRTAKAVEEDGDTDMIALPAITAEDINPSLEKEEGDDEVALHNLATAPVLTGAIPMAVFDSAMKQFQNDPELAAQFFDMFADFDQLPCLKPLLQHVFDHLQQNSPRSASTALCAFQMTLLGIYIHSPEFPAALGRSLELLNSTLQQNPKQRGQILEFAIRQLLPLLQRVEESDEPVLKKVLASSLRKYSRALEEAGSNTGDAIARLVEALQREGNRVDAQKLIGSTAKQWSANERLVELQTALTT